MNNFRASIAAVALAGALCVALSATPAAAVTFTAPSGPSLGDLGPETLGLRDFASEPGKPIGPPHCITGCAIGGGVPEPMSWVLMFLGFGLVGTNLRARHRLDVA